MRARVIESKKAEQQTPKAVDSVVLLRHWDDAQRQAEAPESRIGATKSRRDGTVVRHVRFAYD